MKKSNRNDIAFPAGTETGSLVSLIPVDLAEPGEQFIPCPKTLDWIRETFLNQNSPLYNVEHDHLNSAKIGVLWTSVPNSRQMKNVVATAETGKPPNSLSSWAKARWRYQVDQWFGMEPDFILTFYAPYMAGASEISQLSTFDHELYHCGQKTDAFGLPRFSKKDGKPVFGIRGHDVEEFVGIYRRYGYTAGAGDSIALVAAARGAPEIGQAEIVGVCGTCR